MRSFAMPPNEAKIESTHKNGTQCIYPQLKEGHRSGRTPPYGHQLIKYHSVNLLRNYIPRIAYE